MATLPWRVLYNVYLTCCFHQIFVIFAISALSKAHAHLSTNIWCFVIRHLLLKYYILSWKEIGTDAKWYWYYFKFSIYLKVEPIHHIYMWPTGLCNSLPLLVETCVYSDMSCPWPMHVQYLLYEARAQSELQANRDVTVYTCMFA